MQKIDRALLVAVNTNNLEDTQNSLDELEELALAASIKPVDKVIQSLQSIDPRHYVGSGKVSELKHIISLRDIDILICDDTLSASQIRNLEAALEIQIMDRSFLILQIFAERAQTRQAILEVSLAQKLYMLPRLIGMSKSLSRQGGGSFNAKGPGETKLELDRRKLSEEITFIRKQLSVIKKERAISRKKRTESNIPVVALMGYTNAGKSSLMNYLATNFGLDKDEVFEKNMLFATLDTKTKRIQRPNKPPFILIDTVGFISKLPTELVASFESTLNDIASADLIIHVIDGKNPNYDHIAFVNHILKQLNLNEIPRLLVVTKSDIYQKTLSIPDDYIDISSKTGKNIDILLQSMDALLYPEHRIYTLKIPFHDGHIYQLIKENAQILETNYESDGILVKAILSPKQANQYQHLSL